MGFDASCPEEEEEEENKQEKEVCKNNLTKPNKMNQLDPEDAIFLVDVFLGECKVNNISL